MNFYLITVFIGIKLLCVIVLEYPAQQNIQPQSGKENSSDETRKPEFKSQEIETYLETYPISPFFTLGGTRQKPKNCV